MIKKFKEMDKQDKKDLIKKAVYVTGMAAIGITVAYVTYKNYNPTVDLENYKNDLEEQLETLNSVLND